MTNILDLTGKTYIVTGAASGIGRATALLISAYGAKVLLIDIDEEKLSIVASECEGETDSLVLDLTDSVAINNKLKEKLTNIGKINGFVHCAGLPYVSPLNAIKYDKADIVHKLNTYAVIELAKICSKRTNYAGENGSFVLISSVYGLVGSSANSVYAMSKGAIIALTKALAIELAPKGIRVNCIAPGFIKTPMMTDISGSFDNEYYSRLNALHPMGLGEAKDIANGILYLLSDMSKWVTGSVLNIDGGFTAQ